MLLEHRLSALLQLHLHSRLNTWLQWIGRSHPKTRRETFMFFGFGASYDRSFTVAQIMAHHRFVEEPLSEVLCYVMLCYVMLCYAPILHVLNLSESKGLR